MTTLIYIIGGITLYLVCLYRHYLADTRNKRQR